MSGVVIAETLRRHLTSVAYVSGVSLLGIIALGVSRFQQPAAVWPSLITLLALIAGSGAIGPEFSRGTLQLILTKPINRSTYLLSRVAGVVLVVWTAIGVAGGLELLGRVVWGGGEGIGALGARTLNTTANAVLTCALLVLFASVTRAYFNVAIYVTLMIGLNVGEGLLGMIRVSRGSLGQWLNRHTAIERTLAAVNHNLFPDAPMAFDRDWLLLVLSNAAVALVLACFAFRRREVPYGAD